MNVRLFLLVAMTACFVALWSSDRQYQEDQMAIARAARQAAAERETASIKMRVVPTISAPATATPSITVPSTAPSSTAVSSITVSSIAVSSIVVSSTVAPSFASASDATPFRQPVVATRVAKERSFQIVSYAVSFRRPSFRFEADRVFDDVSPGGSAHPQRGPETDFAGLFRWAGRVRSEIEGETCWMRWQMRRMTFFAQRRVTVLLRQRLDWYALAQKFARVALWQLDPVPKNAAASPSDEKR